MSGGISQAGAIRRSKTTPPKNVAEEGFLLVVAGESH